MLYQPELIIGFIQVDLFQLISCFIDITRSDIICSDIICGDIIFCDIIFSEIIFSDIICGDIIFSDIIIATTGRRGVPCCYSYIKLETDNKELKLKES